MLSEIPLSVFLSSRLSTVLQKQDGNWQTMTAVHRYPPEVSSILTFPFMRKHSGNAQNGRGRLYSEPRDLKKHGYQPYPGTAAYCAAGDLHSETCGPYAPGSSGDGRSTGFILWEFLLAVLETEVKGPE